VTLTALQKAPFPWFGGKRDAAPAVWTALGDVPHYVEPFAGSLAVLLERPHLPNRPYLSETVNDLDGLLINFWRAIRFHPDETADAASWPVAEYDKHARSCRLLAWRDSEAAAHLAGDPDWCDPVMAGWWVWAVSVQIGAWGAGGPWWPDTDGKLRRLPGSRGAPADRPHLGDDGRGVNHAGAREPGLGTDAKRPHLGNNGQGVNHAGAREAGLGTEVDDGYVYHPMTMPEITRWFRYLSARLRHVRILNGDWRRALTNGASLTLPVRMGAGPAGIFLDPPYGSLDRADLYGRHESFTVAAEVHQWAADNGDDPRRRIVVAGFHGEGDLLEAAGWRTVEWFRGGFLKGGMGNVGGGNQQHRERLWLSPHCLTPDDEEQGLW